MALLGDVFLNTVYDDSPNQSVDVSEHPIENGESVVDHISRNALTMSITGIVTGKDAAQRRAKLEAYKNSGKLLKYSNRMILSDVIIKDFQSTHDVTISGGFKFSITLFQVRISKASILKDLKLPVKMQVAPVGNKGRQQAKAKPKKKAIQKKSTKKKTAAKKK